MGQETMVAGLRQSTWALQRLQAQKHRGDLELKCVVRAFSLHRCLCIFCSFCPSLMCRVRGRSGIFSVFQ